jgi:hypothetical protein
MRGSGAGTRRELVGGRGFSSGACLWNVGNHAQTSRGSAKGFLGQAIGNRFERGKLTRLIVGLGLSFTRHQLLLNLERA